MHVLTLEEIQRLLIQAKENGCFKLLLLELSTIIGRVSSSTTLNVCTHVTDEMRRTAAIKIDQGIGKANLQAKTEATPRENLPPAPSKPIKGSSTKLAWAVSSRSTKNSGKGGTPLPDQTAKNMPAMSTPATRRNAKTAGRTDTEIKTEIAAEKDRLKADPKAD